MRERERSAWTCNHKSHGGQVIRKFLLPGDDSPPSCHEGHTMTRQPNKPYMQPKKKGRKAK